MSEIWLKLFWLIKNEKLKNSIQCNLNYTILIKIYTSNAYKKKKLLCHNDNVITLWV